ncbi:MAG: transporter [Sphingobacteriales bacterium]|nr:MAG: transporter [Sphingobacteriales bacterium]
MKTYLLLFSLLFISFYSYAQEPPTKHSEMNVDMPDETEETDLVDVHTIQLETAFLHNGYKDGESSNIGQAMLRYGVAKRLELRLLIEDGGMRDKYLDETVQSTYPMALGTKVQLLKDHKILPDITFVGYLKLPFTSRNKEQEMYWSPIALLAFQHEFGDKWKLEYNIGTQQEAFGPDWSFLGNGSVHYKVTDPLELFFEYYAQFSNEETASHNLGAGVAYQLGEHFEFYASTGARIDTEDNNHFFAGGVAFRL